ncbi:uncharacterized protein LTHEOB_12970 [Lasiodiplodia theobromae]|uniref:uncharacterized protein n=1 Tax=Lasiodiplodia theobromae TaxID=45133 RepID=UPI0015C3CDAD|nr:uncharacterized protein LTHEOB_12970 [Lasiodiplodia theobromae]KAF4534214.1 hypothetical protein LTHEOB_12970 [Lasiodiplodia theobromae]
MAAPLRGQTKAEDIRNAYGLTLHQWERFLWHTKEEAKTLFYTHEYWTNSKKPDDVQWIDVEGDIHERYLKNINDRLEKCHVTVDYRLMRWRLLILMRRKPKKDEQANASEPSANQENDEQADLSGPSVNQETDDQANSSEPSANQENDDQGNSSEPNYSKLPFDPITESGGRKAN